MQCSAVFLLRYAITEQHVTGEYGLTVDTLFGDDGVAVGRQQASTPCAFFFWPCCDEGDSEVCVGKSTSTLEVGGTMMSSHENFY